MNVSITSFAVCILLAGRHKIRSARAFNRNRQLISAEFPGSSDRLPDSEIISREIRRNDPEMPGRTAVSNPPFS
jgi:hypothetical protein